MKRKKHRDLLDFITLDRKVWTGREITDWIQFAKEPWTIFRPGSRAEQEAKEKILAVRANPPEKPTRQNTSARPKHREFPRAVYNILTREVRKVSVAESLELVKQSNWYAGSRQMMIDHIHYAMNPELKVFTSCSIYKELPEGWIKGQPPTELGFVRISLKSIC